jgi:hypothetical protein
MWILVAGPRAQYAASFLFRTKRKKRQPFSGLSM